MNGKVKTYPVSEIKKWVCTGTPEYFDSIMELGVLEPIIVGKDDSGIKILAGQRRVASLLKCVATFEDNGTSVPEHLKGIKAVVFEGLSETDQAAITIAENEQRSANPIATWKAIHEAQKRGDFDAVVALSKINKARLKSIQKLNQVRPALIDAYDNGMIAEGTLLATATLGGARQDYLLTLLKAEEKKRITMSDVAEAKKARTAAVLATRPQLPNTPVDIKLPETWFLILTAEQLEKEGKKNLNDGLSEMLNRTDGAKLYRLVEVG